MLVNQFWFVLVTRVTTGAQAQATSQGLTEGIGLTPYMSAFLIFQVPHSIVTVSLVTALLPTLSSLAAEGRMREVAIDLAQALRTTVVFLAPAAAVFVALGPTAHRGRLRQRQHQCRRTRATSGSCSPPRHRHCCSSPATT